MSHSETFNQVYTSGTRKYYPYLQKSGGLQPFCVLHTKNGEYVHCMLCEKTVRGETSLVECQEAHIKSPKHQHMLENNWNDLDEAQKRAKLLKVCQKHTLLAVQDSTNITKFYFMNRGAYVTRKDFVGKYGSVENVRVFTESMLRLPDHTDFAKLKATFNRAMSIIGLVPPAEGSSWPEEKKNELLQAVEAEFRQSENYAQFFRVTGGRSGAKSELEKFIDELRAAATSRVTDDGLSLGQNDNAGQVAGSGGYGASGRNDDESSDSDIDDVDEALPTASDPTTTATPNTEDTVSDCGASEVTVMDICGEVLVNNRGYGPDDLEFLASIEKLQYLWLCDEDDIDRVYPEIRGEGLQLWTQALIDMGCLTILDLQVQGQIRNCDPKFSFILKAIHTGFKHATMGRDSLTQLIRRLNMAKFLDIEPLIQSGMPPEKIWWATCLKEFHSAHHGFNFLSVLNYVQQTLRDNYKVPPPADSLTTCHPDYVPSPTTGSASASPESARQTAAPTIPTTLTVSDSGIYQPGTSQELQFQNNNRALRSIGSHLRQDWAKDAFFAQTINDPKKYEKYYFEELGPGTVHMRKFVNDKKKWTEEDQRNAGHPSGNWFTKFTTFVCEEMPKHIMDTDPSHYDFKTWGPYEQAREEFIGRRAHVQDEIYRYMWDNKPSTRSSRVNLMYAFSFYIQHQFPDFLKDLQVLRRAWAALGSPDSTPTTESEINWKKPWEKKGNYGGLQYGEIKKNAFSLLHKAVDEIDPEKVKEALEKYNCFTSQKERCGFVTLESLLQFRDVSNHGKSENDNDLKPKGWTAWQYAKWHLGEAEKEASAVGHSGSHKGCYGEEWYKKIKEIISILEEVGCTDEMCGSV